MENPPPREKLQELRLRALLTEYDSLKRELLQKFRHQLQMYYIIIVAVGALLGYVLTEKVYDVFLIIPLVGTAFGSRYIWDQYIITRIGDHLRTLESDLIPSVIGHREGRAELASSQLWIGWEHYFMERFPNARFYKGTIELLFVFLPTFPAVVYSMVIILQAFTRLNLQISSNVPVSIHIVLTLLYLSLGSFLAHKLWTA